MGEEGGGVERALFTITKYSYKYVYIACLIHIFLFKLHFGKEKGGEGTFVQSEITYRNI